MPEWKDRYDVWTKAKGEDKKKAMSELVKTLDPYVFKEANKWKGQLSPKVIDAKAKYHTIQAIKNYDPTKAALPTHVTNQVRQISRTIYSSGTLSIPEGVLLGMRSFKQAYSRLEDFHGREPLVEELQDELAWPKNKVELLLKKLKSESVINENNASFITQPKYDSSQSMRLSAVYHDLNARDKQIMEHAWGYAGKPILSTTDIAKKTGVSPGFISQRKAVIDKKMTEVLGRR